MTDREKVIRGLKCCGRWTEAGIWNEVFCSQCPYDSPEIGCAHILAADALSLLWADGKPVPRPARLMTEEEVMSQPEGAVVWRECHLFNGQYELRSMVCDGKSHCGDFGLSVECKYDFSYRYYVRYWTDRPTNEQREAVKWDERRTD